MLTHKIVCALCCVAQHCRPIVWCLWSEWPRPYVAALLLELNAKQVLVYVLDVAGSEGRDAMSDLLALKEELDLYLPGALLD